MSSTLSVDTAEEAARCLAEPPESQVMPKSIGRANLDDDDDEVAEDLWDESVDAGLRPEAREGDKVNRWEQALVYGQLGCCCLLCIGIAAGILLPYFMTQMDPNIREAVRRGDIQTVREKFDENPKLNVDAPGQDEKTALHWAVIKNHPDLIDFLLERRANIELGSETGDAAIHYAARQGHKPIVSMLLAKGANVNATNANGWTALHWTAVYGHSEVAKQLLEADIDVFAEADDAHHKTALSLAQSNRFVDIAKLLEKAMKEAEDSHKVVARERFPAEKI